MADREIAGLRCSEVLELAGSFVLGALPESEADAVRRHLAECPEAHAEVAELGGVTPALLESVEPAEPPAGLKDRILAAAAESAQPPPRSLPPVEPTRTSREVGTGFGALVRRPAWAALALAAALAVVALGAWNVQLRDEIAGLAAYRDGVVEVLEEAARPGAQLALLTAPEGPTAAGPTGLAAVGADGSVALVMRDLAPTTGAQVYEAWLIAADGAPIPIGHFTVGGSRTASFVTAQPPLGSRVTVALTLEPGPGATTPTLPIVAIGAVGAAES